MVNKGYLQHYLTYNIHKDKDCSYMMMHKFVYIFSKLFLAKKIVCVRGTVMLPNTFTGDFGDQIGRYAILVDPNNNEFQVVVKKRSMVVFF